MKLFPFLNILNSKINLSRMKTTPITPTSISLIYKPVYVSLNICMEANNESKVNSIYKKCIYTQCTFSIPLEYFQHLKCSQKSLNRKIGSKFISLLILQPLIRFLSYYYLFAELSSTKAPTSDDEIVIESFDVPSPAFTDESIELKCNYKLDNTKLYSVKWYKDNVEFYRHVPNENPNTISHPTNGIKIDVSKNALLNEFLISLPLFFMSKSLHAFNGHSDNQSNVFFVIKYREKLSCGRFKRRNVNA